MAFHRPIPGPPRPGENYFPSMRRRDVISDMVDPKPDATHWICPYDPRHVVSNRRIRAHLAACRRSHRGEELKTCPFNAMHDVKAEQLYHHICVCPDRISVDTFDGPQCNRHHIVVGDVSVPPNVRPFADVNAALEEDWEEELRRPQPLSLIPPPAPNATDLACERFSKQFAREILRSDDFDHIKSLAKHRDKLRKKGLLPPKGFWPPEKSHSSPVVESLLSEDWEEKGRQMDLSPSRVEVGSSLSGSLETRRINSRFFDGIIEDDAIVNLDQALTMELDVSQVEGWVLEHFEKDENSGADTSTPVEMMKPRLVSYGEDVADEEKDLSIMKEIFMENYKDVINGDAFEDIAKSFKDLSFNVDPSLVEEYTSKKKSREKIENSESVKIPKEKRAEIPSLLSNLHMDSTKRRVIASNNLNEQSDHKPNAPSIEKLNACDDYLHERGSNAKEIDYSVIPSIKKNPNTVKIPWKNFCDKPEVADENDGDDPRRSRDASPTAADEQISDVLFQSPLIIDNLLDDIFGDLKKLAKDGLERILSERLVCSQCRVRRCEDNQ